jgi:hypothetical protein
MPFLSNNNDWTYYSSAVPGYAEKFGNNGMRERNKRYLGKLNGKRKVDRESLVNLLIENNMPLAMLAATRVYNNVKLAHRKESYTLDDTFQDCCFAMTKMIKEKQLLDIPPAYFQSNLYLTMYTYAFNRANSAEIENQMPSQRFDEQDYPQDAATIPNEEFIWWITRALLSKRESEILYRYYVREESFQDIGESFLLTGERTRQISVKAIKKLKERLRNFIKNPSSSVTLNDFFKEKLEPWNISPNTSSSNTESMSLTSPETAMTFPSKSDGSKDTISGQFMSWLRSAQADRTSITRP